MHIWTIKTKTMRLLMIIIIVFQSSIYCINIHSQTLTSNYDETAQLGASGEYGITVNFEINDLPDQISNIDKFRSGAYYRAFVLYGDGNFERLGTLENPVTDEFKFSHTYRRISNEYPIKILLESRKDDDDPPEALEVPFGENISGSIDHHVVINIDNQNTEEHLYCDVTGEGTMPTVPMITEEEDVIKLGLSSHHKVSNDTGFYFLQQNTHHAFPIAFRSSTEGLLLFFYRSADSISYDPGVPSNVPNYFKLDPTNFTTPPMTPMELFNAKSTSIVKTPKFNNNFYIPSIGALNVGESDFDTLLYHYINNEEGDLVNNEVREGFPDNNRMGELRLTHFLKTNNGIPDTFNLDNFSSIPNAKFLAILYNLNEVDSAALDSLNGWNRIDTIPPFLRIFNEKLSEEKVFNFQGFDTLSAKKGEPNDPGGLCIEHIANYNDQQSEVFFKLEFCNAPVASAQAEGAEVYLDIREDDNENDILSDIRMMNTIVDLSLGRRLGDRDREIGGAQEPDNLPIHPDFDISYTFSANLGPNDDDYGLIPTECGAIYFSALMDNSYLPLLTEQPVMDYCVHFKPDQDAGAFCRPNKILEDSLCTQVSVNVNSSINYRCDINPILRDKDKNCDDVISSKYQCRWNWCRIPILPLCCCCLLLIFIFGYFLFYHRKKKKKM